MEVDTHNTETLLAVSVTGPLTDLGDHVLIHEHLLFDFTSRWRPS